jgi:hypothetical protein
MLRKLVLLAVAMSLVAPTAALAQTQATKREQSACNGDTRRYCRTAIAGGDMSVLSCLQEHRTRLSRSCKKVLESNGV